MDVWTIITTLVTGAVLGIALMCGILYLAIKADDRKRVAQRVETERRIGASSEEQVVDFGVNPNL